MCCATAVVMESAPRWHALAGTVTCLFGCIDSNGLRVDGVIAINGVGGTAGNPAIGVGGSSSSSPTDTGGTVVASSTGAGGVRTSTEPPSVAPDPACGMACFGPDASTIAYWAFDTVEKGQVQDLSGNGFDATVHGSSNLLPATCGSAISLSGNYLDVEGWSKLVGYSTVAYDVLFRIHGMSNDGTAGGDMLSELVNDSYWYPIGGAVVRVRNRVCQFAVASTSGWQHLTDVVPVTIDEWHHVAAAFDQTTKTMTLQLDCNAPVRMTYSGTFLTSFVSRLRIGACIVDPPSRFVNGEIDAIRIRGW
jgi:hypothetical protein